MNTLKIIFLLGMLSSCFNVSNISESQDYQTGEIVIKVCSRGCYQYVLQTEDEIYFPTNLSEDYKILETTKVRYQGKVLESTTDITKTSPTDLPVYDFTCKNIEISFMEKISE